MKEPLTSEVLDDLVQIVTHRIASLTAGVEGYADLLVDSLHTPEQRRLVRHILEGVSRINGVVEDLQFFTRPVEPMVVPLRVSSLVEGVLDVLSDAERDQIAASLVDADVLRVEGDPHLCRQALHALIRNALDAARPEGAVRVDVEATASHVDIRIWNEGPALAPEMANRAIAPFFTTKAQNLGLGLTIAERMADAQGGSICFEPVEEGTEVRLRLPRAVAQ